MNESKKTSHIQWLKQHAEFNTQKRTEAEKTVTKMEKSCTNNEQYWIRKNSEKSNK